MMGILSSRQARLSSPRTWSDLTARFEAMPIWTLLDGHMIRVEDHSDKGRYTLRAELPGVDPEKDIDITSVTLI